MTTLSIQSNTAELLAREHVARSLAMALGEPGRLPPGRVDAGTIALFRAAWDVYSLLQEERGHPPLPENHRAALARWLGHPVRFRQEVHLTIHGLLVSGPCPPYETEYLPSDQGNHRAHALADISGFYRAFGLHPNPTRPERPDHLALELEFHGFLLAKAAAAGRDRERQEICLDALTKFFARHLLVWLPGFLAGFQARLEKLLHAGCSHEGAVEDHLALAALTRAWLEGEMALLGVTAPDRRVSIPLQEVLSSPAGCCPGGCGGIAEEFTCGGEEV